VCTASSNMLFLVSIERERVTRERLRDLAVFERLYGNPSKSSTEIAVKKVRFTLYSFEFSCLWC